ncbi:hypothetical protein [Mumia quercus]|uniref:hypothetical protein n=1 Tax=Mumia quercus TaxID=2976125 RepID=UPI0021D0B616|nr:hypothetical protein [Mumia quercus]
MTAEKEVRTAFAARVTGLVLAGVLVTGATAFWVFGPFDIDNDLRHARRLVSTQEHQRAVVVDSEDVPSEEYEDLGSAIAVVRLPDGSHADLWTTDTGFAAIFGGPDEGERLTVVVDPDNPTWAASVADAEASVLSHARYLFVSLVLHIGGILAIAGGLLTLGRAMPFRAYRSLRRPRDHVRAEVVAVMWAARRAKERVTLRLRVGEDDYSWDATLPAGCVPYVGGFLDLHGDVRDGGWVMAPDPEHGVAFPRARLRKWGAQPSTRS